jgi:hypothetical protein
VETVRGGRVKEVGLTKKRMQNKRRGHRGADRGGVKRGGDREGERAGEKEVKRGERGVEECREEEQVEARSLANVERPKAYKRVN